MDAKFTKRQIISSERYRRYRDVLAVILSDGAAYSHKEIKKALDGFLKKPVKNKINGKGE